MEAKEHHILVVDDIKDNLMLIVKYLREAGKSYNVFAVPNAQIALKILQEENIDLVITDWEMPQMSGIDLLQTIKQNPQTKDIPVMIITGMRTRAEDLKLALDKGASDFIRKPINSIELWARVSAALTIYDSFKIIQAQKETIEDQKNRELSAKTLQIHQKNKTLQLYF